MAAVIKLTPIKSNQNVVATFEVTFQGFPIPTGMELSFFEVDSADDSLMTVGRRQLIGKVLGELAVLVDQKPKPPLIALIPRQPATTSNGSKRISFVFPQPIPAASLEFIFDLPTDVADKFEGDFWEIMAVADDPAKTQSFTIPVARVIRALPSRPGSATYPWESGNIVQFYHDGSSSAGGGAGAFADLDKAIDDARHFIFIADWSFHPHMRLSHNIGTGVKDTIGAKLIGKARNNADLVIAIHTWDHTNLGAPDGQNDFGDTHLQNISQNLFTADRPINLRWRASSRTGIGFSHHQKFVVLDAPADGGRRTVKVFFGGLDLTKGRLDWGDHHLFPSDKPNGTGFTDSISYTRAGPHVFDDYYSAEFFPDDDSENGGNLKNLDITLPRQPWHDIHAQLTGATAWDVIREFVGRWNLDPSSSDAMGDDSNADIKLILDKFLDLFNHKVDGQETRLFLQQWEHGSGPWNAQVYRSMVKEHWGSPSPVTTPARTKTRKEFEWAVSGTVERSIQEAYEKAIGQAERFIYIETQYLIGSGNLWGRGTVANPLPQLIADRIVARHQAKEPFHAYIVVPMFPEGDPSSPANGAQRQFQWTTMRAMIRRVQAGVGAKWEDHLSFYFLANWKDRPGGIVNKGKRRDRVRANERYMVYVHSKMMIIDDRYVILGSANLNERSLNGVRDSEICIGMWPASDKVAATCVKQVQAFREGIWKEHLGSNVPSSFKDPESPTCITVVQKTADDNYKQFRNGKAPANGHLCRWPIDPDAGFPMKQVSSAPEGDSFLPDGEDQKAIWRWDAPGKHSVFPLGDLTKPGQDIAE